MGLIPLCCVDAWKRINSSIQQLYALNHVHVQCADVHMISDSEGDDFEDASEFGVDDSEMFGMGSSSSRKSPMSMCHLTDHR